MGCRYWWWRSGIWKSSGEKELELVFKEAMEDGLNLWDFAVVYGMGASENVLAAFYKEISL